MEDELNVCPKCGDVTLDELQDGRMACPECGETYTADELAKAWAEAEQGMYAEWNAGYMRDIGFGNFR